MAKTESTAVNELIDQMHRPKPMALEPAADLFAAPPSTRPTGRASSPKIPLPPPHGRASSPAVASSHPARMTSTIPPMRGAGEVAPLPRARAPHSTAEHSLPSLPDAKLRMSTAPVARGTTIPPLPSQGPALPARAATPKATRSRSTAPMGTLPPPTAPVAAPFERAKLLAKLSSPDLPIPRTDLVINSDETWVGHLPAGRTREDNIALAKKLVVPAIACIAAGIALGFYVTGNKAKPAARKATPTATTASTPTTAMPAPSAPPTETVLHPTPRSAESQNAATSTAGGGEPQPPTKAEQAAQVVAATDGALTSDAPAEAVAKVRDVPTAKGAISLTDVRIDTDPQGASITLVDRGNHFPLGSTPLSTSLDRSRQYDVIIELTGRAPQTVHVDPATTTRLAISLGRKPHAAAPAKSAAVAVVTTEAPTTDAPKAEEAAATGNGTLMVSSKPPCEILIDGKTTGLTTPQRAIDLAAGHHKITFVNHDAGIKKTMNVMIKAGEPTKLIQDLMAN